MTDKRAPQSFRPLHSITRLLVGGLVLGSEAFKERLQSWEKEDQELPEVIDVEPQKPLPFDPLPEQLPPPGLVVRSRDDLSEVRYALIGLLFEGEKQLENGLALTARVTRFAGRFFNPLIHPFTKIPNPVQKPFGKLVKRGQSEVNRWVNRGREEEYLSRQLAREAATTTFDESINYMAQNPALGELVQQQSVSLAIQILEQIRENAVSADYFFEGLVRYALRRRPRYLLPPPSPKVRDQATWTLRDFRHEGH